MGQDESLVSNIETTRSVPWRDPASCVPSSGKINGRTDDDDSTPEERRATRLLDAPSAAGEFASQTLIGLEEDTDVNRQHACRGREVMAKTLC